MNDEPKMVIRELAKKMGDAGYCNHDACIQYLQAAYSTGTADENEACAKLADAAVTSFATKRALKELSATIRSRQEPQAANE